ncbi:MAG: hypothetical protein JWO03_3588 [Bacteroidetes bacterium]|nr:hypothetical protein [Bacteroidota bacterium]
MYSKVKILGHPIHPMIVAFPVAFYTGTLVTNIIYACTLNSFWFKAALACNIAGVAAALLAAVPGFIDWLAIPSSKGAKKTGLYHMAANVSALVLFTINIFIQYNRMDDVQPEATASIIICAAGFVLTIVAGFLGWTLVQNHHVGVSLTQAQENLEPAEGVKG